MPPRIDRATPAERKEIIEGWRRAVGDPARVERCRRWALDILTEGMMVDGEGDVGELDDDDRAEYIDFLADQLALGLVRYLSFWVMSDMPLVDDWQRRRRRQRFRSVGS